MWVWVATDLNWTIQRKVTVGDNVTYDAARNFYVFGYLIVSYLLQENSVLSLNCVLF